MSSFYQQSVIGHISPPIIFFDVDVVDVAAALFLYGLLSFDIHIYLYL